VTRIVAGFAGSLSLQVPKSGTRPTSDRTREGIFSALEARDEISGTRVLDLYAGSGALGLEAISRGAASAILVDSSSDAAAVCRRNARTVREAARGRTAPTIEIVARPALAYLQTPVNAFDLVFIDPPYDVDEDDLERVLSALAPRLGEDAVVVLERSVRSPEPRWPDGIEMLRSKSYGETVVYYATTAAGADSAG
jgi:16S rRNA (guanine966-N2)-methyltransferase